MLGLGKTGYSCVQFLVAQHQRLIVMDDREHPPFADQLIADSSINQGQLYYEFGAFDADLIGRAKRVILSPGIPLAHICLTQAKNRGKAIIGDIDLFCCHVKGKLIAITGSNGKSTVTAMIHHMLSTLGHSVVMGGNIGLPVLSLLERPAHDYYVLELSSFQLETVHFLKQHIGVYLNLTADHMDRYDSLTAYGEAKLRIFRDAQSVIFNCEDPATYPQQSGFDGPQWSFAIDDMDADFYFDRNLRQIMSGQDTIMDCDQLKIKGIHNYQNAMVVFAVARALGLNLKAVADSLTTYQGLPHRLEYVQSADGIDYYNDSKATNIGAAIAAINGLGPTLKGKIVLIAGGVSKGAEFFDLITPLKQWVRHIILIGKDITAFERALFGKMAFEHCESMETAVQTAKRVAKPGDGVLLAPACASFDMFDNFEHRGEVFKAIVQAVANQPHSSEAIAKSIDSVAKTIANKELDHG